MLHIPILLSQVLLWLNMLVLVALGLLIGTQNIFNPIPVSFGLGLVVFVVSLFMGALLFWGLLWYTRSMNKEIALLGSGIQKHFHILLSLLNVVYLVSLMVLLSLFLSGVHRLIIRGNNLMD